MSIILNYMKHWGPPLCVGVLTTMLMLFVMRWA